MTPTMPHILRLLLAGPERRRAAGLVYLLRAPERHRVRRDVARHHAARRDERAVPEPDRRDQHRGGPYEHTCADCCLKLVKAVIIAGDRAGADVRLRADLAVAEIAQVVGLGAPPDPGRLHLDEVADMHVG